MKEVVIYTVYILILIGVKFYNDRSIYLKYGAEVNHFASAFYDLILYFIGWNIIEMVFGWGLSKLDLACASTLYGLSLRWIIFDPLFAIKVLNLDFEYYGTTSVIDRFMKKVQRKFGTALFLKVILLCLSIYLMFLYY